MKNEVNIRLMKIILQNQENGEDELRREIESYGRDVCVSHFKMMTDDGYINSSFDNDKVIVHSITEKGRELLHVL